MWKTFLYSATILSFVLLAVTRITINVGTEDRPENTVVHDGEVTYDLEPNGGTILVKALIDGTEGSFIIDTGASLTSISTDFAKRIGLPLEEGAHPASTANGITQTRHGSRASTIALGGAAVGGLNLSVLDNLDGEDGLIGMDFLRQFKVTLTDTSLTIKDMTKRFVPPKADWEERPCGCWSQPISLPATHV